MALERGQKKERNVEMPTATCTPIRDLMNLKSLPFNPNTYWCWDEVSFVKGLDLITKESKQGVTILLFMH